MANENPETRKESVTLTFKSDAELDLFDQLQAEADEDDRTISKYIVRKLNSMLTTAS